MNQNDQMREALRREFPLLDEIGLDQELHHCEWSIQQERKRLHQLLDKLQTEQALAAEPAPPVRLTLQQKAKVLREVASELEDSLSFNFGHAHRVANAIMDAMERVNRRQLDQTPNSPSE